MMTLKRVQVTKMRRRILDGISFSTSPGEITAALGVNGAGKSSLVRLMSGEWQPDHGEVLWLGRPLHKLDPKMVAQGRAVVNQQVDLRFDFSVREVVEMGRYPHSTDALTNRSIVKACLNEMELTRYLEQPVTRLSGGERRRVWLARALAQLAEVRERGEGLLILDEPTAHLDLRHQELLLRRLRILADGGMSVFVVLHDLNHAARVADRVLLIEQGKLVADGRSEAVMTTDRLSTLYELPLRRVDTGQGRPTWRPDDPQTCSQQFEPVTL